MRRRESTRVEICGSAATITDRESTAWACCVPRATIAVGGVTPGADFGRLQRGEPVGGVSPDQVLGPPREGRKIVISGDTIPCEAVAVAAHRADVLVHEATFAEAAGIVLRKAKGFGHNSFKIDLARRAIVRALSQAARGTPQSQSNKKIA